jgi:hypothetical protein
VFSAKFVSAIGLVSTTNACFTKSATAARLRATVRLVRTSTVTAELNLIGAGTFVSGC